MQISDSVLLSFGQRIRTLRLEKKLSQKTLAELSGLDRTYISSLEQGKRNVSLKALAALSISFDINLSELFSGISVNE